MQSVNTPEAQAQRDKELRLVRRAKDARTTSESRLLALQKESALAYGQTAFALFHSAFSRRLQEDLEEFAADPGKARQFASVFPFFDGFKSPDHIAAVALVAAVDQLSRRQRLLSYCQGLAGTLEAEAKLLKLESKQPADIYQLIKTHGAKKLIEDKVLMSLGVVAAKWTRKTKADIGLYLAFALQHSTGLIEINRGQVGRTAPYFVEPSEAALTLVKTVPRGSLRVAHGPMTCLPRSWDSSLMGGGMLTNQKALITLTIQDQDRAEALLPYQRADLSRIVIPAINYLQQVPLEVSAEVVAAQRTAWDAGMPGLFPCSRVAPPWPERIGGGDSIEAWKIRKHLEGKVLEDRKKFRNMRIKIERSLQVAEEIAGQTVYQPYMTDSRGRTYTTNRLVSSQGTDREKATLNFKPELAGDEGLDWLLISAAGHSHLGRASWKERLEWGQQNIELIRAAADDPLNRTELWRSTKDPWQFLQACVGIRDTLDGLPTGAPVRMDQTTSGIGILAALVRDAKVGRQCNLWGSTRSDLYTDVIKRIEKQLLLDLEDPDTPHAKENASFWLEHGIERKMMKTPVLAAPYGGTMRSISEPIIEYLIAEKYVPEERYHLDIAFPGRYLARIAHKEIKQMTSSVMQVRKWLMACCKESLKQQIQLQWTGPFGWPMIVADRETRTQFISSFLYGTRKKIVYMDSPAEMKLNYIAANKSIGANLVHSLDAALVHSVSYECAERKLPLLVNHDCYACQPFRAKELHQLLLKQIRSLYTPDLLADIHAEMQARTGLKLPQPPVVGDLNPALIGENSYLFS